jgi:hypothetical protein
MDVKAITELIENYVRPATFRSALKCSNRVNHCHPKPEPRRI